jgi:enoyl-CoA hydratase/carnithine racemase
MELVETKDSGRARVLTMNRPQARNAMDTALLSALLDALSAAVHDDRVRVVVLAGAGGSFSAGADLREELDHAGQLRRIELFCEVYEAVAGCVKPTIAAVAGHCVGGGVEVAAACDLRVADSSAQFRFPGAALGIPVGAAKLVGLVGLGAAKDLVFTSRTFDAGEAERIGFVQRRVAEGDALDAALETAEQIAANHPQALAYLKRQFGRFSGLPDHVAAENDGLRAITEARGDYRSLLDKPGVSGRWTDE